MTSSDTMRTARESHRLTGGRQVMPNPINARTTSSRRSGVFLLPRPRKFGRHPRLVCPQAAAKRKHREEDREVDSGETHSAKESAKEVKQSLPAGARIQLDENAGDERGVTRC